MKTEAELAREALQVQDACNLSGVVRTFARVTADLWVIANSKNEGTEWVNRHPVSRAFADKIISMSGDLDFDTYDPTIEALNLLYPLVVPDGVIVFDEYASMKWGESNAVDEFFKDKGFVYKSIPWALSPSAFLIKNGSIRKN